MYPGAACGLGIMVPRGEEWLLLLLPGPLSCQRWRMLINCKPGPRKVRGDGVGSPGLLSPFLDITDTWPQLQGSCGLQRQNGWLSDSPGLHSEGPGIVSGLLICARSSLYERSTEPVSAAVARLDAVSPTYPSGNRIHSLNSIDWGGY